MREKTTLCTKCGESLSTQPGETTLCMRCGEEWFTEPEQSDSMLDEARRFVKAYKKDIHNASDVFQTAHMLLEACLEEIERLNAQGAVPPSTP